MVSFASKEEILTTVLVKAKMILASGIISNSVATVPKLDVISTSL